MNVEIQLPGNIVITSVYNKFYFFYNVASFLKDLPATLLTYVQYYGGIDTDLLAHSILFLLPLLFNKHCRFLRNGTYRVPRKQVRAHLEWALYVGFYPMFTMSPTDMSIDLREFTTEGAYLRELQRFNSNDLGEIINGYPETMLFSKEYFGKLAGKIVEINSKSTPRLHFSRTVVRNILSAAVRMGSLEDPWVLNYQAKVTRIDPDIVSYFNQIDHKCGQFHIWRFTCLDGIHYLLSPEENLSGSFLQQELRK
nr:MAG: viral suppressor of RNA silencing [Plant associated polerovirus 1]UVK78404.1 MAG: viral suppressor of RNA silencing [Plant associated polerovirus 1]